MKKVAKPVLALALMFSLAACGNASSDLDGQWSAKVSLAGIGDMAVPNSTITITEDAITSGGQATKIAKWEKSGNQVTAFNAQGQGIVFKITDHDHATVDMGGSTLELTRLK